MHPLLHPLFIDYLAYFNGNEDYFECHEVLEVYWKVIAPVEKVHRLVGYDQLATGMYHWRRENFDGAARILKKAIDNFETNAGSPFFEYIDFARLLRDMSTLYARIKSHESFSRINIPLTNAALKKATEEKIAATAPLDPQFILHKHMLRDRSEVIAERELSKQIRAFNRKETKR